MRKILGAGVALAVVVLIAFHMLAASLEGGKDGGVHIKLDKAAYSPNDEIVLRVINNGRTEVTTGYHFLLYKRENGNWKEQSVPILFIEIAVIVKPGEYWEQKVSLGELNLPPGHYKIVKRVWTGEGYLDIGAEFDIRG